MKRVVYPIPKRIRNCCVRWLSCQRHILCLMKLTLVFNLLFSFQVKADTPEKTSIPSSSVEKISQQSIRGKVTNENGEALAGVSVRLKGTTTGATTSADGTYTLSAPSTGTLVFSYVGFTTYEITIEGRTTINIVLQKKDIDLDEVVAIGYGTVKKSDLTGAVSSVSNKQFKDQPVKRVEDILQGRAAGVEVTTLSGMPGSAPKVRIRGTTSINKNSDPLYVIDGIVGSLESINPSDIQSLEVLKDASSTAIYGSRGANGVVLVTTRKGAEGKTMISLDASFGYSNLSKQYDLLNAYDYALALNDIRGSATISAPDLEAYKNGTKGIDWMDVITQTGIAKEYKLTISGGNEKNRYFISGNLLDQDAITVTSKFQRYGFRVNLDNELTPWLTMSTKLNASRAYTHNGSLDLVTALNYSPTMEMKNETTGVYNVDPYNALTQNPYGARMVNYDDSYRYYLNGNVTFLFKIIDGLTFSTQGGYNYYNLPSYTFNSKLVGPGQANGMSNKSGLNIYWQNTNNLTYQKTFGDHSLTTTAVFEVNKHEDTGLSISGTNLSNEIVGYWNIGNAATRNDGNWYGASAIASGILRANYDYKKRYFVTAALRTDGSSRFQKDNKWGYFPSLALAWDVAKESFMSDQNLFQQMKLRASYGVTGNQDITPYSTLGMLQSTSYGWGTSENYTGYWGNSFASPNVSWEKTYQYDIGLDFSILNNTLNFTFDWFKKTPKNLLFQKVVPMYNGGGSFWVNQGEVKNTGVELSMTAYPLKSNTITWETNFNASFVKNEIIDLAGNDFILGYNYSDYGGPMQVMKPGYPIGSFHLYQWKGFDDKGANLYQKADGSLTTSPTADDLTTMGQSNPAWNFGWNNTLSWKNWSANIFVNAATGASRLNLSHYTVASMSGGYRFFTLHDAYFKGWDYVSDKSQAEYPSLSNSDSKNFGNSDRWLEDASFVRLKNVSLAYRIPKQVVKFADIQLSLSAQNLLTITKYKGMDPEVFNLGEGLDFGAYPSSRTVTFGAKLTF